jgi:hypothetical protein
MSDIKLFRVNAGKVDELTGTKDTIEKSVQTFFEKNLESLLGVRFLASEFGTSNGRIDSLGLDAPHGVACGLKRDWVTGA